MEYLLITFNLLFFNYSKMQSYYFLLTNHIMIQFHIAIILILGSFLF